MHKKIGTITLLLAFSFPLYAQDIQMNCPIDQNGTMVTVKFSKAANNPGVVEALFKGKWMDPCAPSGKRSSGGKYWDKSKIVGEKFWSCTIKYFENYPELKTVGIVEYNFSTRQRIHRIMDKSKNFNAELERKVYSCH
jgi:hypothetical protein